MPETNSAKAPAGRLAFFKAGRHTSVDGREIEFTESQLRDAVASYDPAVHEAPLVVGHPQLNAPAYGWAGKLHFEDGLVATDAQQVDPTFAEMVNAGRFKKVSASWYLPDSPGNPKPGHLYLRHIGFLGAAPPALKGLPDASFAANDGAVVVEFAAPGMRPHRGAMGAVADLFRKVKGHLSKSMPADQVNGILPDWQISSVEAADPDHDGDIDAIPSPAFAADPRGSVTTETDMSDTKTAEFAERETALKKQADEQAAREAALKDRETAIANAERNARKKGLAEFVEGLAKEGRILPRHKTPLVEVMCAFDAAQTVSFAEGDGKTVTKGTTDVLKEFLSSLPKQVDFAEKSGDRGEGREPVNFAAAEGAQVDPARLEIHGKAQAYQRANKGCSYIDAVRAVSGG